MNHLMNKIQQTFGYLAHIVQQRANFFALRWRGGKSRSSKKVLFFLSSSHNHFEQEVLLHTITSLQAAYGTQTPPEIDVVYLENSTRQVSRSPLANLAEHAHQYIAFATASPWVAGMLAHEIEISKIPTGLIFAGIPDPDLLGLVRNLHTSGSMATGSYTKSLSFAQSLQTIKTLRPDMRRVIIPCDFSIRVKNMVDHEYGHTYGLIQECERQNLEPHIVPVSSAGLIAPFIEKEISSDSLVAITRSSSVLSRGQELLDLCSSKNIPAFAMDLLTARRGAVFSTGESGGMYGKYVAEALYAIHMNGERMEDMLLHPIQERSQLFFHPIMLREQGVNVCQDQMNLLEAQSVLTVQD